MENKLNNRDLLLEGTLFLKQEQPNLETFQNLKPHEQEANMTDEELWGYAGNAIIDTYDGQGARTRAVRKLERLVNAEAGNFNGTQITSATSEGQTPDEIFEHINNMDPVDFENMIFEQFGEFMLLCFREHGEVTKDKTDFWFEESTDYYSRPEVDETFRYTEEQLRRVIDFKIKENCQPDEVETNDEE